MNYHLQTAVIFMVAVACYLAGTTYSSGPLLLAGFALEVWCLVRAAKKKKPPL